MNPTQVDQGLKPIMLKDLRTMARARGLSPAGGKEQLSDRIRDYMLATGDFNFSIPTDDGGAGAPQPNQSEQYGHASQQAIANNRPSQISFGASAPAPPMQNYQPGGAYPGGPAAYGASSNDQSGGSLQNNYARPNGQNVGNYITERSSSRILAPPGGHCQISFGDYVPPQQTARYGQPQPMQQGLPAGTTQAPEQPFQIGGNAPSGNNYARPGGQNVGNFLSDRPSSRVLNPPGGRSQITFG